MIRVVVVDDEALVRAGFTHILNTADDIEVVAAVDGGRAVRAVRESRPDVVLPDIRMPDVDGLADRRRLPDPPVVAMLTTFDNDEYVATALCSGAAGFLLKDTDREKHPVPPKTRPRSDSARIDPGCPVGRPPGRRSRAVRTSIAHRT